MARGHGGPALPGPAPSRPPAASGRVGTRSGVEPPRDAQLPRFSGSAGSLGNNLTLSPWELE